MISTCTESLGRPSARCVRLLVFQRLALPIPVGHTRIPGIKIHDTRMMRLLEVLLHAGPQLAGWRTATIHAAILSAFGFTADQYSLTQLRYDLRKLKAHSFGLQIDPRTRRRSSRRIIRQIRPSNISSIFLPPEISEKKILQMSAARGYAFSRTAPRKSGPSGSQPSAHSSQRSAISCQQSATIAAAPIARAAR